ncbi:hypothetical protein GEMRC1_003366 [Eukaryota sp. GEM-RC1]
MSYNNTCEHVLAPGLTKNLNILYKPHCLAPQQSFFKLIVEAVGGDEQQSLVIPVKAIKPFPVLEMESVLDFGFCWVGEELDHEFCLNNDGGFATFKLLTVEQYQSGNIENLDNSGDSEVDSISLANNQLSISPASFTISTHESLYFTFNCTSEGLVTDKFVLISDQGAVREVEVKITAQKPSLLIEGVDMNYLSISQIPSVFPGESSSISFSLTNPTNLPIPFSFEFTAHPWISATFDDDNFDVFGLVNLFSINPNQGMIDGQSTVECFVSFTCDFPFDSKFLVNLNCHILNNYVAIPPPTGLAFALPMSSSCVSFTSEYFKISPPTITTSVSLSQRKSFEVTLHNQSNQSLFFGLESSSQSLFFWKPKMIEIPKLESRKAQVVVDCTKEKVDSHKFHDSSTINIYSDSHFLLKRKNSDSILNYCLYKLVLILFSKKSFEIKNNEKFKIKCDMNFVFDDRSAHNILFPNQQFSYSVIIDPQSKVTVETDLVTGPFHGITHESFFENFSSYLNFEFSPVSVVSDCKSFTLHEVLHVTSEVYEPYFDIPQSILIDQLFSTIPLEKCISVRNTSPLSSVVTVSAASCQSNLIVEFDMTDPLSFEPLETKNLNFWIRVDDICDNLSFDSIIVFRIFFKVDNVWVEKPSKLVFTSCRSVTPLTFELNQFNHLFSNISNISVPTVEELNSNIEALNNQIEIFKNPALTEPESKSKADKRKRNLNLIL